uniref:Uncharacterized protein n=1 Tax=Megaselia scalaris TaxID=36166 RepID=T1GTN4_MEGSC
MKKVAQKKVLNFKFLLTRKYSRYRAMGKFYDLENCRCILMSVKMDCAAGLSVQTRTRRDRLDLECHCVL